MGFSERYGYKPTKDIQLEFIDKELRISLWNLLQNYFFKFIEVPFTLANIKGNKFYFFLRNEVWGQFLKEPVDELRSMYFINDLKEIYFGMDWYKVYDLLEFITKNYPERPYSSRKIEFVNRCNIILKKENSAYRLIREQITPITSEEEIAEIEEALNETGPFKPVSIQINDSLKFLSDRKTPNYRNSIKESISAVESLCRIITQKEKATLGQLLKLIEARIGLHGALKAAFSQLYGYTSDKDGIRHGLLDESNIGFEDAKFMLVACSAFINYVKVKITKFPSK